MEELSPNAEQQCCGVLQGSEQRVNTLDAVRESTLLERLENDYAYTLERATNLRRAIDILKANPVVVEFSDLCARAQRF